MGGNHKKNLRAEKAKVKLKGAKLPKGLNVTKTEFKVRKIIFHEQLRSDVVHEKVDIKETLSKLKHHGTSIRTDSLRNLREAISGGDLKRHLGAVVKGVAAASLDAEKEPRRESFKTLSSLLGTLPTATIAPFFHVISSYLRCAMTHIQPQLQEDALLMLDVLLQHVPQLVAEHSNKILQHFLELISRVRTDGGGGDRRVLSATVGQKQTTIRWRANVLQRLQHMLQTLVEHQRRLSRTEGRSVRTHVHTVNVKEKQYFTLRRTLWDGNHSSGSNLASILCQSTETMHVSDDAVILRNHIAHLMPLLRETWLEVRPATDTDARNSTTLLTSEAALTLQTVLDLIGHLWQLVALHEADQQQRDLSEWFRCEYASVFAATFLPTGDAFPYQQNVTAPAGVTKRKSGKPPAAPALGGADPLCSAQNLKLAQLMAQFNAEEAARQQRSNFGKLLQYLNAIVREQRPVLADQHRCVEAALRSYLLDNARTLLLVEGEQMRSLVRATIHGFLNKEFSTSDSRILLLLCEIVQTPDLFTAYGTAEFQPFLEYLPQLLLQPSTSESVLLAMSSLGKQQNVCFLNSLVANASAVIGNLQQIHVAGAVNTFEGKKHIVNLFYWPAESWLAENGQALMRLIESINDKRLVAYASFILN